MTIKCPHVTIYTIYVYNKPTCTNYNELALYIIYYTELLQNSIPLLPHVGM